VKEKERKKNTCSVLRFLDWSSTSCASDATPLRSAAAILAIRLFHTVDK